MKRKVGLWIDNRKAVIVFLASQALQRKLTVIEKNVSKIAALRAKIMELEKENQ